MTYKELIEKTRELGVAIQDTDEFTAFIVAKTAADKSEKLQDKLGQFNLKKLDLNRAIIADEKDNEKIAALNAEVKTLYEEIVSDPLMIAYSTTKDELDGVVRFMMQIIEGSANGENPRIRGASLRRGLFCLRRLPLKMRND